MPKEVTKLDLLSALNSLLKVLYAKEHQLFASQIRMLRLLVIGEFSQNREASLTTLILVMDQLIGIFGNAFPDRELANTTFATRRIALEYIDSIPLSDW